MTEQTDAAEVGLSEIVEDLTDLPLSWDFFPEPDAALDDVARLIRAREAAAEARGAERALREAADAYGPAQITYMGPADGYVKAWLRARAAAAGGAR